tara:strand:- start:550 stop:1713 length:1164 start_codon:yes stop_codon:yes gene_type:complete
LQDFLAEASDWIASVTTPILDLVGADPNARWIEDVVVGTLAVLFALLFHQIVLIVVRRIGKRTPYLTAADLVRRLKRPSRWLLVAFALAWVRPALSLNARAAAIWDQIAGLVVPALVGWLAVALIRVANGFVQRRADISVEDNLHARRRRTRADILFRIASVVVILITFCAMLMSIPSVRSIGVTLAASAGLAALAVGAAAQPALKNLIAGIQMALTEPIRIDDVVIIEGEWGKIEEIRMTYVVVKIWDERRLVVPVSKFLEDSFQNWTRQTSELLGSVFWYLDANADIDRFRAKHKEVVEANPRWDGRFNNIQVTDTKPNGSVEVRGLMTAKDAPTAFDLRCDVREAMLKFVREEMPEAVLRYRSEAEISPPLRFADPAPPPSAPQ